MPTKKNPPKRKYEVRVGQAWFDTDPRMEGRCMIVESIKDGYAFVWRRGRQRPEWPKMASLTRLAVARMEAGLGWRPEKPEECSL